MRPERSWTVGPRCSPPVGGLHQAFARLAKERPAAAALVSARGVTTYGALDRAADGLAAVLRARGVRPGHCVPVVLPRGEELVIALLGVLKAGAAYALLDPAWPEPHRLEVLAMLDAPVLIGPGAAADRRDVVAVGEFPPAPPPDFSPASVAPGDPCCAFFTSGTTGRPKAVVTPHRATARLFGAGSFARFGTDTVVPLAAPTPWDAFALELWAALLTGGTAVLVDEPFLSAGSLRSGIARHGVNTVWLTSSLFNMVVEEDVDAFAGLRLVMTGGERLSARHVRRFLARHPAAGLVNGYGPVESTVFATTHRVAPADCDHPDGIPIGRPVPGTEIHVLDGSAPCDVGQPGEICIAGDGLASRYLDDEDLTAERFTRLRLDGREVRVYRSGDLGMWGDDGLLYFRGRADRQLKVRGHRVEPAEVERQVERRLTSVRSCRVVAHRTGDGAADRLVAFCVPTRPGDPLTGAAAELGAALPPHHRPSQVVSVEAFPTTARGKLDEQALLAMAAGATPVAAAPAAPQPAGDMLQLVVGEFATVLGRDRVPPDAGFFELGGDSLAAGRVCARLGERLETPVPVSRLYQHPSAAALAGWLREAAPAQAVGPGNGETPLTPMQVVFLTRQLVDPTDLTNLCLLAWIVDGELDRRALEAAIGAVHERHEPLRAAYTLDPRPVARLVDLPPPPLEVLPEYPSAGAALDGIRAELAQPLDPTVADVWRVVVASVAGSQVAIVGCAVHHVAFDGWSESVLASELAAAYDPAGALPAPPPTLDAAWRLRAAQSERADLGSQRRHLARELADLPELSWPAPPPATAPGAIGTIEVLLAPRDVAAVDELAAGAGVTRFVTLLWMWGRSVAEVTGQRDFAVGVPVDQRAGLGLERAIGCHINTVCLRLRGGALGAGPASLAEMGRLVSRAFGAQDVPFAEAVELAPPPERGRPPLFQTLFALQGTPVPRLELAGARAEFVRQRYLDLPVELHGEVWPTAGGGLRLEVSYRNDALPDVVARDIADWFSRHVASVPAGARP